jgi:hypothetical protein
VHDIGRRRERGRYGYDGEEYETKCKGIGEVHVSVIEIEYQCIRLLL